MSFPLDDNNNNLFQWMIAIGDRMIAHTTLGVVPVITQFPRVRSAQAGFKQQFDKLTKAVLGTGFPDATGRPHSGLGILVSMPVTTNTSTKLGTLTATVITRISVYESKLYNSNRDTGFAPEGIGFHCDDVAVAHARYLRGFSIDDICQQALPQEIQTIIPVQDESDPEKSDITVSYFDVHANVGWTVPPRCPNPVPITFNAGLCTITVPAGCIVYYTTDGETYPSAANVTQNGAVKYIAPFAVISGIEILAVATAPLLDDGNVVGAIAP